MGESSRQIWVARGELTLARRERFPLRDLPLDPDPLTGLAWAMAGVEADKGERLEVVVDLLPLTPGDRRRRRRGAVREHDGRHRFSGRELLGTGGVAAVQAQLLGRGGQRSSGGQATPPEGWMARREKLVEGHAVAEKVLGHDPAFWLQLLIRAESRVKGRHTALLQDALAAFQPWAGENYFRQMGPRIGMIHLGSDTIWSRWRFDRRWRTGLHSRTRRNWVSSAEIAGLLKPPTRHCRADNVARSGGVIPPAPQGLPTYVEGRDDLLPLGHITTKNGDRPVGVYRRESLFSYKSGRAGYGKTDEAIAQASALFRSGEGGLFLDPHAEGAAKLKEYLGELPNVWHVDLSDVNIERQAGWNLFSMEGCTSRDIPAKVSAVYGSFGAALGWDERKAPRALTLTMMASQALCELALRLPPHLAPTIFQMTSILGDDEWRNAILPYLSPHSRGFFRTRLPTDGQAILPVTNLIDRMRSSPQVAALFGSPVSTYDIRAAMDAGDVVLWSPPAGTDAWANLMSCLVCYDLFRAAMSRQDTRPADRRTFWAFIDELQTISGTGSGSAGESVAHMLEQVRKMGVRLMLLSQDPIRLAKATLGAILTNRSHLATHVIGADSAAVLAKEWAGAVDPGTITKLKKHTSIVQVTLAGQVTRPFLVCGFNLAEDEPWTSWHRPELLDRLEDRIDRNLRRRPVSEVLEDLDTLEDRIIDELEHHHQPTTSRSPRTPDPFAPIPTPATRRPTRRGSGQLVVLEGGPDSDEDNDQ